MVAWNDENVAHLLSRAGFGASDRDRAKYLKLGQAVAVEKLASVTPSAARGRGASDYDPTTREKLKVWWAKRMVKATSRRLQEKMTLFWHDHFATSITVTKNNLRMALQNQTFRFYGLGSFRELVYRMTKDAAMLDFLDGDRNKIGKPNENYARELQELFTLGVIDLNGVENYTQTDVSDMARCLTGFVIQNDVGVFDPSRFDGGTKTLYAGRSFPAATGNIGIEDGSGNQLPPTRNALDVLFTHRDSDGQLTVPRFLGKKLWEYFAYPGPSKTRIDEVAAPFIAAGFLVSDLLRAIFLHDDFYSDEAKTSSVKNPCEFAFHGIRALAGRTNGATLPDQLEAMGMALLDPPTVNGWDGGLSWLSSGQFLARIKFGQGLAAGRDSTLKLTPTKLFPTTATTAAEVVDALLGHLGIAARVPPGARQVLIDYFGAAPNFTDPTVIEKKVRGAIALMLALPECSVH
jgi:uncharacterized protein (DUF1800 family)